MKTKSDLIIHPVRMKLIIELGGREMTTRQLADALPDIAQATLYRQIKILHEGGIIHVVSENEINGGVERTFGLAEAQNRLTEAEIAGMSADDHIEAFSIFSANLLEQFSAYTTHSPPENYVSDGLSYNQATIYLTAQEKNELQEKLVEVVGAYLGRASTPSPSQSPSRQKYTLASIVIPSKREPK